MIFWLLMACAMQQPAPPTATPVTPQAPAMESWRGLPLDYTRHARCRMDCRHIEEAEVAEVLAKGKLIPERSRHDGECPSHALEARVADGTELRIVFAACDDQARVVTAIDLGKEWPCSCQ